MVFQFHRIILKNYDLTIYGTEKNDKKAETKSYRVF